MEHNLLQTSLDNAAYKDQDKPTRISGVTQKDKPGRNMGHMTIKSHKKAWLALEEPADPHKRHIFKQSQGKTVTLQTDLNKMPSSRASPPPPRLLSWTLVILQRQARMPLISTQAGLREGFHLSQRTWEILSLQHIWEQTSFVENNQNIKHFFYKK